jgi:hypothetical protein
MRKQGGVSLWIDALRMDESTAKGELIVPLLQSVQENMSI